MPPSIEHNALVEMFRSNPALVPRFMAELLGMQVPPDASATVVEAALDQLVPIEYRADLVLELRDRAGELLAAVVLEVQLGEDPQKKLSWPVYVAVLRARKGCPAYVVVIAPDARIAAWAAKPIPLDLDPAGSVVVPKVLGPQQLPPITEPAEAVQEPELGVLSARAHGNDPEGLPVVLAALAGLETLDATTAGVYFHIIYKALREPVRRALRAMAIDKEQIPKFTELSFVEDFFEDLFGERLREAKREAKREAMHEARLEARLEAQREAKAEVLREALVELARHAGLALSAADQARIEACSDIATLKRWIENALTAKTAQELLS